MAESFFERYQGIRHRSVVGGVVLRTSAVHTIGLPVALEMIALDRHRKVIDTRTLLPNRLAWFRGARYVVELQVGSVLPELGSEVHFS